MFFSPRINKIRYYKYPQPTHTNIMYNYNTPMRNAHALDLDILGKLPEPGKLNGNFEPAEHLLVHIKIKPVAKIKILIDVDRASGPRGCLLSFSSTLKKKQQQKTQQKNCVPQKKYEICTSTESPKRKNLALNLTSALVFLFQSYSGGFY